MLHGGSGADVLCHLAAEGYGECLDASADAEDRNLTVIGQTRDEQLGQIALTVDAVEQRGRLLACPQRIEVAATAEQETIDAREGVDDDIGIGYRGDDQGHTACGDNAIVIAATQAQLSVLIIASNANHRAALGLREMREGSTQIGSYVKGIHRRSSSSITMGISRFRLCSREMRVSVATTPGMLCNLPLSSSISCSLSRA